MWWKVIFLDRGNRYPRNRAAFLYPTKSTRPRRATNHDGLAPFRVTRPSRPYPHASSDADAGKPSIVAEYAMTIFGPPRFSTPAPRLAEYLPEPRPESTHGGYRSRSTPQKDNVPLVSVVTIVRNGAQAFPHAAESVLSQDYANVEYVVIDGGSTDGTVELIRSLGARVA